MNEVKQQQLTWSKGMTNVPSDLICDDNTCESEVNMIYRMGEHRPIQDAKEILDGKELSPILFVHKYNDYKHYIASKDNKIIWYKEDGTAGGDIDNAPEVGDNVQVQAIGNTIIVNSSNGLGYYVWKKNEDKYKYLGERIPEPKVRFGLYWKDEKNKYSPFQNVDGIVDTHGTILDAEQYTNLMVGMYSAMKNDIKKAGGFINPFFVRYAVEMFDGEYISISVPVLMLPYVENNSLIAGSDQYQSVKGFYMRYWYRPLYLCYTMETDYSGWEDLVKGVTVFVSKDIDLYITDGNAIVRTDKITIDGEEVTGIKITSFSLGVANNGDLSSLKDAKMTLTEETHKWSTMTGFFSGFRPFENKTSSELKAELADAAPFYRLCSIGREAKTSWTAMDIKVNTLAYLETNEQLPDDYFSHCVKTCSQIGVYNNRLHMASVNRYFWSGGEQFLGWDNNVEIKYNICVYIHTGSGDRIIKKELTTSERFPIYVFYPDPRAYKMEVYKIFMNNDREIKVQLTSIRLKEHQTLNGAYYLSGIPGMDAEDILIPNGPFLDLTEVPTPNDDAEFLSNEVWVSEVNNPWVFKSIGVVTIGNGRVKAIANMTTALSQGQFGQYPLIAFCTDGIWALQTTTEGIYSSVQPMSREICNNLDSVTETDGLVFFTSEKGLMMINGSKVDCVSEQLNGKVTAIDSAVYNDTISENINLDFKTFLKDCFIAYDYRDSLLWIMNEAYDYAFIYSIKDGTFGVKTNVSTARTVNDYPDSLIQSHKHKVYSLLDRVDINKDEKLYNCELITRPMKWENSLALKTLIRRRLIFEKVLDDNAEIRVFASNDCKRWYRLMSLRGRGFKYWKFVIKFRNMKAVDTFSGAIINTQERYTYRMR